MPVVAVSIIGKTPTRWTLAALLAVVATVRGAEACAQARALVDELEVAATRYHEDPSRLFRIREGLEQAITTDEHVDNLNGLAWVSYIIGGLSGTTREQKLAVYDRGREVARRAIELYPRSVVAHFWYGVNTGRWGQANGILRSLFLLPTIQKEMEIVLDLDPSFTPVYNLAGSVYYEVPWLLGGDLNRAEEMFRTGLAQDPRDTAIRLGLGKTLIRKKRIAEARRELQAVLDEKEPRNLADWTLQDSPAARELLESIKRKS
jgi:tetratricopeptide (TPR) repeat protein